MKMIVKVGSEEMIIKKEVLEQIILHSIIGGVIASCEIEGEMFTEEEKEIFFRYRPARDVLDQLLKTK